MGDRERFLQQADDESFNAVFRVFSPQLVAFFRRRVRKGIAEDLAQEVMLIVYRKAGHLRDHKLFHAWLFKVARHATCRYFAQRTREVPPWMWPTSAILCPPRIRVHSSLRENSRIG